MYTQEPSFADGDKVQWRRMLSTADGRHKQEDIAEAQRLFGKIIWF
jgi:hypothetical protein